MGQILHANAKTTPRIRAEIQASGENLSSLAKKYSVNIKTIRYWKNADKISDKRSGPTKPKSVLSDIQQQILCEFRRATKTSLDEIFITFKEKIPVLTRSNLHRCFQRNGISVLPKDTEKTKRSKFKEYPIGFVHIDITEVRIDKQKRYIFVAIDRATKYIYAEIYDRMTQENSCIFLRNLIKNCPFKIDKILTDNGAQFTHIFRVKRPTKKTHPFDEICKENQTEHRLTKFFHPWTNGQVEITNKLIKNHTTRRYFYSSIDELKQHLQAFLMYYNFQRKAKNLKFETPYQKVVDFYKTHQQLFKENPMEKIVGLNIKFGSW